METKTQSTNTNTNPSKVVFYNELFNQFDLLVEGVKNKLYLKSYSNSSITSERKKLVNCKKDLNEASNILLSLETFQDSISLSKRRELISQCNYRFKKFEEVKEALEFYHDNMKRHFLNEEEYKLGTVNNKESKRSTYLKLDNQELDNDNDLTEHLLLEETRKNLEITAQNMNEVQTGMISQSKQLENLNGELYQGQKYIKHSKKAISIISNKRFYTKLILHLAVILLFVGIVCGIIIKFAYKSRSSRNKTKDETDKSFLKSLYVADRISSFGEIDNKETISDIDLTAIPLENSSVNDNHMSSIDVKETLIKDEDFENHKSI